MRKMLQIHYCPPTKLSVFTIAVAFVVLTGAGVCQSTEVDLTGEVLEMYADDFAHHRAERFYVLHDSTSGELYRLRFRDGEHREFRTGMRLRVRGHRDGKEITLPAYGASVEADVVASAAVTGEQKTIVIGVNFQNAKLECTQAQIQGTMFTGSESVAGMYLETSFGNIWFTGDVVGPYNINYNSSGVCDATPWANAADAAAQAAGVNLSQYKHKVYVLPEVNGCGWAGLGTIGGNPSRAWVAACDLDDVYAHELGHNLGMHHASTDTNNDDVSDCEYCDDSDFMGYAGTGLRTLNSPHKEELGWQPAGKVQVVASNSVLQVAPLEKVPTDTPYPQTLKITKPGTSEYYYFSYRRMLGYDVNLPASYADRTSVHHYAGSGAVQTFLVKTLSDNGSFTDPSSGLTVVQLSHNTDFATLNISYGCSRAAPAVATSPASQSAQPGTMLSYVVSLTNADSISCGSSTFLLTPTAPAGWSVSTVPNSLTLAPNQAGTVNLSVTSPSDAASGAYTPTVQITENFNLIHDVSTSVTYTVLGTTPAGDTTPPTAPPTFTAKARRRRVKLAWLPATDNVGVVAYLIYRDGALATQTTGLKFRDRGLTQGVTYSYTVTAKDAAGNESAANVATVVIGGKHPAD
jgi:hypothetical protein